MEAASLVEQLEDFFAAHASGIDAVYLFGSQATGRAKATSDVDLGVLFSRPPEPALGNAPHRLEAELEERLGQPVQLTPLNGAPVDLVHRVLRDGRLLFEGSRERRVRFEVESRRAYLDLLPFLRRYRGLGDPVQ